jgi:hypothetical protein
VKLLLPPSTLVGVVGVLGELLNTWPEPSICPLLSRSQSKESPLDMVLEALTLNWRFKGAGGNLFWPAADPEGAAGGASAPEGLDILFDGTNYIK